MTPSYHNTLDNNQIQELIDAILVAAKSGSDDQFKELNSMTHIPQQTRDERAAKIQVELALISAGVQLLGNVLKNLNNLAASVEQIAINTTPQ